MLKCAAACVALLATVVCGVQVPVKQEPPLSDRSLKREIRRYYRSVPNLSLWDDIDVHPVKVLCDTPKFCFYCPLAVATGKPFFLSSEIRRPTSDDINEVGLKCLRSLHDSDYGHLLTVIDYIALAVFESDMTPGRVRRRGGQLAVRRAQNKLKIIQKLVCGEEVQRFGNECRLRLLVQT
ncbi:hypothetical protein BSKO_06649 [Bryopsis sp. KO-2023]|nr:hypothetical protein BSKO_06649 [Bryopsis sp. KO-2023]